MKSVRLLQRNAALRQLFDARPTLRRALHQTRAPLQQSFRTRPMLQPKASTPSTSRSIHTPQRPTTHSFTQAFKRRKPNGRRYNSTSEPPSNPSPSIRERLKKMSREYGWTAVGVYFALSALDFPFCFLAVRLIGTDIIGHYEHVIVEGIKSVVKWPVKQAGGAKLVEGAVDEVGGGDELKEVDRSAKKRILEEKGEEQVVIEDHGYKAAERANAGDSASLWTQLALAYAVHKSFIFIRVPLTAAVLPKVVKTLRSWGWNIGKMPSRHKAVTAGVNTKGSKVKPSD